MPRRDDKTKNHGCHICQWNTHPTPRCRQTHFAFYKLVAKFNIVSGTVFVPKFQKQGAQLPEPRNRHFHLFTIYSQSLTLWVARSLFRNSKNKAHKKHGVSEIRKPIAPEIPKQVGQLPALPTRNVQLFYKLVEHFCIVSCTFLSPNMLKQVAIAGTPNSQSWTSRPQHSKQCDSGVTIWWFVQWNLPLCEFEANCERNVRKKTRQRHGITESMKWSNANRLGPYTNVLKHFLQHINRCCYPKGWAATR